MLYVFLFWESILCLTMLQSPVILFIKILIYLEIYLFPCTIWPIWSWILLWVTIFLAVLSAFFLMEMKRLGSSIYQLWGCLLSRIYEVMDQGHLSLQECHRGFLPASCCFFLDNRAVRTHCGGDSPAASGDFHIVMWSFHFRCVHQHPLCFLMRATLPYYVWRFVPRFQE